MRGVESIGSFLSAMFTLHWILLHGMKTIPDSASVHIQKLCFWHEFCDGVKLCRADLVSVASHIGYAPCHTLPKWCSVSVNRYSNRSGSAEINRRRK